MSNSSAIGSRLREIRKSKHITLKELGVTTSLSISFLSDMELGKSLPSIDTLTLLASSLNVTVSYLLNEEKEVPVNDDELVELLRDYPQWITSDKHELLAYLRVKKIIRQQAIVQ